MTVFLMTVKTVVHFPDQGTVMEGLLQSGALCVGETVQIQSPSNVVHAQVRGIERISTKESLTSATRGEEVGLLFDPIDFSELSDGVVFEEYGRIRPRAILIARSHEPRKWWQLWK